MTTDRHDWDHGEREALAGLDDQIDAMRRRHAGDPPYELIRAAHADALPSDLQSAVADHLAASRFSRTLAEGLGEDEPELSQADQTRLLARVMREARAESKPARAWGWLRPALASTGVLALASLVWFVSSDTEVDTPADPAALEIAVAPTPAVPAFLLPFAKPDVRLGMGALTWRGPTTAGDGNQLLTDLKPGLDAYRQDDYATADRELTALAGRYPGTIEILFYQGVSRLFRNDYSGAIAAFDAAAAIGDQTFAADVDWYRAVAEQRSGNTAQARARLDAICGAGGTGAARACTALEQMTSAEDAPR